MRRCKTAPPSCRQAGTPCCKDCADKACKTRCQNSPDRCGCWENSPAPQHRKHRVDAARVACLSDKGLTQKQIAQRLGCSQQAVSLILSKMEAGESCMI